MKIATYNIWNSENGMPHRNKYIINELRVINADIVCLQEVHNSELARNIAINTGYKYWYFDNYQSTEEGLCILSNMPFEECDSWLDDSNAIYCAVRYNSKKIAIINIHLPWNSVVERERQIVSIITAIDKKRYDYAYIAGDFNCNDSSDVQRYLTGDCLLNNCESMPRWFDLALSYSESSNTNIEHTLDFRGNPRFEHNTIETNSRFDRILLRNTYPQDFPILSNCSIFGRTIYEDIGLMASDHYGVMVEIE